MTQEQMPHSLTLEGREELKVTGVSEVLRFDESAVVLRIGEGTLSVHGSDLRLRTLSTEGGKVGVSGTVDALIYEQVRESRSLWRRLLG
jgi:sporulation protein YabP